MIILSNIQKQFSTEATSAIILKNLDLTISKGTWISIVGPSGSGKSTLLNIVSGLLKPDNGEVYFHQQNLYELTDTSRSNLRRKHMGFIFQDFKLLPYYSVLDNVVLPLYYEKEKKELYGRAEQLLEMVGIPKSLFTRLPSHLLGGEKQRVAIARALIADPEVLFCDEPTGNLDWENRNKIVALLSELNKQGKNILLVTHDMEAAKQGNIVYKLTNGILTELEASL